MAMWMRSCLLILFSLSTGIPAGYAQSRTLENWVTTWATAQSAAPVTPERPMFPPHAPRPDSQSTTRPRPSHVIPAIADNQTVRMIVHTSIGGRRLRIELSNAYGKAIVSIGNAHVAIRTKGSSIDPRTDRQLLFSGNQSVDIRPGVVIVSDPIDLDIKPMSDLAVSLFVVKGDKVPTNHEIGVHTSFIADGDNTAAEEIANASTTTTYLWLRSVDVDAASGAFSVVCLGDSITDGYGTTTDADQAWPTLLAKRFQQQPKGPRISVVNEGISGNEVIRDGAGVSALARLDRDVLSEPGVRWIVLLEGINDINLRGQVAGQGALVADDLIRAYEQIIARVHMHNVKIVGATLTPEEGLWLAGPVGEATRQKVNQWIRTSGMFDAVVDFDAAVRDKDRPGRLRDDFDPGDHIHPNDLGNASMANAFNLSVFTR